MYLHCVSLLLKKKRGGGGKLTFVVYRQLFEMNSIIRDIRGCTMKSVLRECGSRKEISRKMTRIARINASPLFFFRSVRRGNEKTKRGKNVGNWKIIVRP